MELNIWDLFIKIYEAFIKFGKGIYELVTQPIKDNFVFQSTDGTTFKLLNFVLEVLFNKDFGISLETIFGSMSLIDLIAEGIVILIPILIVKGIIK